MSDQTVVPVIRSRKRRLVPPSKRKKALFSCDRCKVRKIACHRSDPSESCGGCSKSGIECETTIKRKKKIRGPIENIGLHYKCLLMLVKSLFPEVDVNNIDALIDVGVRCGIPMPSRYGGNEEECKELKDLSILLTSGKMRSRSSSLDDDAEEMDVKEENYELDSFKIKEEYSEEDLSSVPLSTDANNMCVVVKKPVILFSHKDYIIIDQGGNSHCIGPMGAPGLLDSYIRIIGMKADIDYLQFATFQRLSKCEIVISSTHEPMEARDLTSLFLKNFPYLGDIGRREAGVYVDLFFLKIHPRLLCLDEGNFRELSNRFWAAVSTNSRDKRLTNHSICCMYMVWILGRLYDPSAVSNGVTEATFQSYLHIVKLCLSDIVLTPTLDGIQCCLLLAVYMDNRKRRETGYILLELASRQAISLGLNRKSLLLCTEDKSRIEEMQRTWWTLFVHEVSFSNQMGRSSCIQIEDVNAFYPVCLGVDRGIGYSNGYFGVLDLTKILYEVLEYRKLLSNTNDMFTEHNIDLAMQISTKLTSCFQDLDPVLHDLSDFSDWKAHLHLRYHYYRLLLTLPFFLQVANSPELYTTPVHMLVDQCLQLCITVVTLLEMSSIHGVLNGTLFPDIFYAYHAVMGLVIGYGMITEAGMKLGASCDDIFNAAEKMKKLELSSGVAGGTLLKMSRYIDAFIAGLEFLKGRPTQPLDNVPRPPILTTAKITVQNARVKSEVTPQPVDGEFDDLFLFPGRQGFGEFSVGSLDFGEQQADNGLGGSGFDTIIDGLFKVEGF